MLRRLTFAVITVLIVLTCLAGGGTASVLAVTYPAGWNLVSGPSGSVLTGASGTIYTLQAGDTDYESFPASTPLAGCRGYWAYFPSGGGITFGPGSQSCSTRLQAGAWSLIGNPSATADVAVSGPDSVLTYVPGGDYQAGTVLHAGQGAWALSTAGGLAAMNSVTTAAAVPGASSATASAPPAAAPAPTQNTMALNEVSVSSLVRAIALPGGVGPPQKISVDIRAGSIIPLFVHLDLDDPSTTTWILLDESIKLRYLRQVTAALHTAYPSLSAIYFHVWGYWETDFIPQSVPIRYVDVCVSSDHLFCSYWPDMTARWSDGAYSYQHVYDEDTDRWYPL